MQELICLCASGDERTSDSLNPLHSLFNVSFLSALTISFHPVGVCETLEPRSAADAGRSTESWSAVLSACCWAATHISHSTQGKQFPHSLLERSPAIPIGCC